MNTRTGTTAAGSGLTVRTPVAADEAAWRELYSGYAEFYSVPMNDRILAATWSWLLDPSHPLEGLIYLRAGRPIGLAHFRAQPKPLLGEEAGFLDDLFVQPDQRGAGAASLLITELAGIARDRGWSTVRWITADDNARARRLYDRLATPTNWVTYELKP